MFGLNRDRAWAASTWLWRWKLGAIASSRLVCVAHAGSDDRNHALAALRWLRSPLPSDAAGLFYMAD